MQSLKPADVRFYKKLPSNVSPDFVVEEAKKSVERELEELKKTPIVQDRIAREEISRLKDEISNCDQELQKIEQARKDLKRTQEGLQEREREFSEKALRDRLEETRRNRDAIQIKISDINIIRRVNLLQEDLSKTNREIASLKESA